MIRRRKRVASELLNKLEELRKAKEARSYSPEPYLDPIPLLKKEDSHPEVKQDEEEEYMDMTGEAETKSAVSIAVCPMYREKSAESDGNSDLEYDYIEIDKLRRIDVNDKGKWPSNSKL